MLPRLTETSFTRRLVPNAKKPRLRELPGLQRSRSGNWRNAVISKTTIKSDRSEGPPFSFGGQIDAAVEKCLRCEKAITRSERGRPQRSCCDALPPVKTKSAGEPIWRRLRLHRAAQDTCVEICSPIDKNVLGAIAVTSIISLMS